VWNSVATGAVRPIVKVPTKASFQTVTTGQSATVSSAFSAPQVRFAHVDIPSTFDKYKRDSDESSKEADYSRRAFTYLMGAGGTVATMHMAKVLVQDFLDTWSASADVLALAKMEVDLTKIPEGKNMTFKWRGKPVFVRHRPQSEIEEVRQVDVSSLRHKQTDEERTQKSEWLVVLGICTHLGCVPIADAGDFGGYFCPCHGSHYDASGRIRKGPAPENLEIPAYSFIEDDTKIIVG
jgi:ubiquinol-cytochrome c reductase iron-sulfur subunit